MNCKPFAPALFLLGLATASSAQAAPPNKPASAPNWHTRSKEQGVTENGFAAQLTIRTEARPDGSRVAVATNQGRTSLFYEGYGQTSPRLWSDEFQNGKWVPGGWMWCGTGLSQWELKPGASVALNLPRPYANTRRRRWALFSDTKRGKSVATPSRGKEAIMLLGESGA